MTYIDNEIINKIRLNNNIVDVIGSYIPLTQKGKNQFCVCPFHDDHSPSMSISAEKQIFTCFVCGESGNVFSFLMKYLNIPFDEAVSILGEKCGIKINTKINKKTNKYDEYYKINETVSLFFKNNLNSKDGIKAKKYLESRNINKEIIDEFDIGLSTNSSLGKAFSKKFDIEKLYELDLITGSEFFKDTFTNRIMFPIKDLEGNVVGFSGRIYDIDDKESSKYKNTKETIIFKKGTILYNYHNAKDFIRKNKEIIICEGYMDVIRLNTIGIKNAVAIMGSNMTKEQIEIIKNLKVNVILNLDQDEAGKTGTYSIGEEFLKININPKVIIFKKEKDSDDLITKHGKDEFMYSYRNRIDYIDFKLEYIKKNKNLSNAVDLSHYINEVIENINNLNDPLLSEIKINELSEKYNISKNTLMSKIKKKEIIKSYKIPIQKKRIDKYIISEMRIIYLMLNYPDVIKIYEKNLGYLIDENMKKLANEILSFKIKNKYFDYSDFLSSIINKEELNNTLKEVMSYNHGEEYTDEELDDYINTVKLYSVNKEIEKLRFKIKNSLDMNEKKELLKKIEKMKKEVLEW